MGKINVDALVAFFFWFGYHEIIASVISHGTGVNWWLFQPFVILISLLMFGLTYGSQTKDDMDWYDND
jgi:TM2 domain-containing membrane protein YozV